MLGETDRRRQSTGGSADSARMRPRRQHDGVRRAPVPIRSGRGGARFGWSAARTLSRVAEGEVREDLPDDRGIVQRGDQAEAASTMGTRQHVDAERPVHEGRPAPGTRTGGLHPGAIRICGQRRRRGRGLGHGPSIHDYSGAPAAARGQHAMADEQVRFGPWRHRRQPFQELPQLEDQLPRAVVPRPLELQRDAPVPPQSQPLLRKGRPQDVSAHVLKNS